MMAIAAAGEYFDETGSPLYREPCNDAEVPAPERAVSPCLLALPAITAMSAKPAMTATTETSGQETPMPLQTIQLTLLQQVQLVLAVEEQVNDLKRKVSNLADTPTSTFLEDYQNLLRLVANVVAVQVETPALEEAA